MTQHLDCLSLKSCIVSLKQDAKDNAQELKIKDPHYLPVHISPRELIFCVFIGCWMLLKRRTVKVKLSPH